MRFVFKKGCWNQSSLLPWWSRFIWDFNCNTTRQVLCTSAKETRFKTKQGRIGQMFSRTFPCLSVSVGLQYKKIKTGKITLDGTLFSFWTLTSWPIGERKKWCLRLTAPSLINVQGYTSCVSKTFSIRSPPSGRFCSRSRMCYASSEP